MLDNIMVILTFEAAAVTRDLALGSWMKIVYILVCKPVRTTYTMMSDLSRNCCSLLWLWLCCSPPGIVCSSNTKTGIQGHLRPHLLVSTHLRRMDLIHHAGLVQIIGYRFNLGITASKIFRNIFVQKRFYTNQKIILLIFKFTVKKIIFSV